MGAATSLDLLGLATVLAPSEAALYTASIENSSSVAFEGLDGEMRSIEASLRQLQASLVFTAEDVEWEEETLVKDEVVRVTMTEGILTLDSSDDEAVATALATFAEPQLRIQYAAWGYSDREIEERVEDLVDEIEDSLDFPIEIDAEELLDDSDDLWGIRAVVVREGAGWYVSPLLTVADMQALPMLSWRSDVEIGDEIPVAAVTSSPEEAVTATLNAAFDARAGRRYWSDLAATLPLAERRLVALYGPALIHERSPFANAPRGYAIELERAEFGEVRIDGGRAFLGDADVRIDVYDGYSEYEFAIDGTCFAMTSEYSGRQEPACLEDLERVWPFDLDEIGLDDPMLVAVKESGGWQFSPVATVAHLQAKMSEAIVALSNEGKLDRLFN